MFIFFSSTYLSHPAFKDMTIISGIRGHARVRSLQSILCKKELSKKVERLLILIRALKQILVSSAKINSKSK